MKYGKGTLTTIYDRVNFYRDVYDDPNVTFKREGDKITLISGDGTIINDKLIAKSEDVFDHKFDTYTPLKKQLNENQQILLGQLKINAGSNGSLIKAIHSLFNLLTISSNQLEKDCTEGLLKSKNALARLTRKQAAEVLSAFAQWALEQEEE